MECGGPPEAGSRFYNALGSHPRDGSQRSEGLAHGVHGHGE